MEIFDSLKDAEDRVAVLNSQMAAIRSAWNDILEIDGVLTPEEQRMDEAVCAAGSDENAGWVSPKEFEEFTFSWKREEECWNVEAEVERKLTDQLYNALKGVKDWCDFFCLESKADEDAMLKALTVYGEVRFR